MKAKELKKTYTYSKNDHAFHIDVQLEDYRDAYSDWDFSPFVNRDLDEDLTEYLLECSYEIPFKYNLMISFYILNQVKSEARERKSIIGMYNFFDYKIRQLSNQRIRVFRDIFNYLLFGTILLISGTYVDILFPESIGIKVLSEGIFIGGWVMIWEMFSAWIFDLKKISLKRKHFIRLKDTSLVYAYNKSHNTK